MAFLKHGGYQVRGSVRNLSDPRRMKEVSGAFKDYMDNMEIFEMELLDEASIFRAVQGCDYVVQTAGPYPNRPPKDEFIFLKPGVDGCISVLRAAQ